MHQNSAQLQSHASADNSDRQVGYLLSTLLLILLLTKAFDVPEGSTLYTGAHLTVFLTAALVILRKPFWGIVIIAALLPVERLLPKLSFVTSVYPLLGLATLGGYVWRELIVARTKPHVTWAHVFGLLFLVWIGVSNPTAAFVTGKGIPFVTLAQLVGLMFLTTQLVKTEKELRVLVAAFVLTAVLSASVAIPQVQFGPNSESSLRAVGLSDGPNGAARLFVVALLFTSYLLTINWGRRIRSLALLSIPVLVLGVAATVSRTGFLLLLLATSFLFFAPLKESNRTGRYVTALLLVAIPFIPIDYWRIISGILHSISAGTDSVGFRYMQWLAAIDMWNDHLWQGVGIGQFLHHTPYYGAQFTPFYGLHYVAHNTILGVLTETGVIGLGFFLSMIVSTVVAATKTYLVSPSGDRLSVYIVLCVTLLIVFGGTTGDSQFEKTLWLLLGLNGALQSLLFNAARGKQPARISFRLRLVSALTGKLP